jgi:hypothetical protein
MNREQLSQVTWGLALIALGLIFLGDRLDWLPGISIARLWPVFIIIAGVVQLATPVHGKPLEGLGMVLVGGIFLMHTYRILSLRDSWPLFIVVAGLVMAVGGIGRRLPRRES